MATATALPPEVTTLKPQTTRIPGGAFLITDAKPSDCVFPEDFTEEQKQIAETTANFANNEIVPRSEAIEEKDFSITRRLLKEGGGAWADFCRYSRGVWGAGARQDEFGDRGREHLAAGVVLGGLLGTYGNWDAASGLVRDAGAEGEVSAADRLGRDRCRRMRFRSRLRGRTR